MRVSSQATRSARYQQSLSYLGKISQEPPYEHFSGIQRKAHRLHARVSQTNGEHDEAMYAQRPRSNNRSALFERIQRLCDSNVVSEKLRV